jgi:hypothetical protein
MLSKVRARVGTPTAADFSSATGSPLVQDTTSGLWYGYANGAVYQIATANVQAFGAKGDGVNDDTSAIQDAIDWASSRDSYASEVTGYAIYFPMGLYKITAALTVADGAGVSFVGDGKTKSNIWQTAANTNAFTMVGGNYRGTFRGLRITDSSYAATGSGIAISVGTGNQVYVEDCWISGFGGGVQGDAGSSDINITGNVFEYLYTPIKFSGSPDVYIAGNMFNQVGLINQVAGTYNPSVWFINAGRVQIVGNRFVNDYPMSDQAGMIYLQGTNDFVIEGNVEYPGTTSQCAAVFIKACTGGVISNNVWGLSVDETIHLEGATKNIGIIGNHFTGSAVASIKTTDASVDGLRIIGNSFESAANTYDIEITNAKNVVIDGNNLAKGYSVASSAKAYIGRTNTGGTARSYLNAAPASNTWQVGDTVLFDTPTSGGYIGAVCTVAGTPGTWKSFGAIA